MKHGKAKLLFQLFWTFAKLSPTSFGGGYALIPLIEREVVAKRKWIKQEELVNMFALTGSLPGTVAINSATLVGYRLAGISGAIMATIGILLPTFLIVMLLSILLAVTQDTPKIRAAFTGIKIATVALIVYAGLRMGRTAITDKTGILIAAAALLLLLFTPLHPLLVIIAGAAAGIAIMPFRKKTKSSLSAPKKQEKGNIEYYI